MKHYKTLFCISLAFIATLFISCNQPGQQAATDSGDGQNATAPKNIVMVVSHHVKDFAAWTASFYDHETARQAAQLNMLGIFQDFSDPNYVSVSLGAGNMDAARQFGASEDLKNAMAQAGVTDEPEVKYYEFTYMDTAAAKTSDLRMFVIHKVADYDAWKKVFDEHESGRIAEGISTIVVARNLDDPSEVAVSFSAADLEILKQHLEKPEIKEAMQQAGVVGEPNVMFSRKVPSSVI